MVSAVRSAGAHRTRVAHWQLGPASMSSCAQWHSGLLDRLAATARFRHTATQPLCGCCCAAEQDHSKAVALSPEDDPETIHIFTVASGHMYERLQKIMILSVIKNTRWVLVDIEGDLVMLAPSAILNPAATSSPQSCHSVLCYWQR